MAELTGKLKRLPLGEIKPEGWLKRELDLQVSGLTGHLDEIWDDVSRKSAWLGGHGEAWERGPYYLDGLIPLAYLTDNKSLKDKVSMWVEKIVASADSNGFFGPVHTDDWWPRMVALKALVSYSEATGDKEIIPFLRNFFKYQFNTLDEQPLYMWAAARAFEELIPLKYLYDNTGDGLVRELVLKLKTYSYDWLKIYGKFKYKKPATVYISKGVVNATAKIGAKVDRREKYGNKPPKKKMTRAQIINRNKVPTLKKMMYLHGVNNAMAVKYPVLLNDFLPNPELIELSKRTVQNLMKYHGTAIGMFTSDEPLAGTSPTRGIELCTVVEFMHSLEILLEKTGDPYYADLLERACFNALPAAITPAFTAHQYVQQVNGIAANSKKRDFFNVKSDGTVFGLEPNFGCCTANMHQGFPRFTENLCYKYDEGFCFMTYSPCRISTDFGGVKIIMRETTDYPFKNTAHIVIESLSGNPEVKFTFRVPEYTSLTVNVNGKKAVSGDKDLIAFKKRIVSGDTIDLVFDVPLTVVTNPDKTFSFRKGSLVMATQLRTKCETSGRPPFCDYYYKTVSQWRTMPDMYKKAPVILAVRENPVSDMPFDEKSPPIEIDYRARYVINWAEDKNSAGDIPFRPRVGKEAFTRTLVPYGCTRIRITHQPKL